MAEFDYKQRQTTDAYRKGYELLESGRTLNPDLKVEDLVDVPEFDANSRLTPINQEGDIFMVATRPIGLRQSIKWEGFGISMGACPECLGAGSFLRFGDDGPYEEECVDCGGSGERREGGAPLFWERVRILVVSLLIAIFLNLMLALWLGWI